MNAKTSIALCSIILTASFCAVLIIFALQGNQAAVETMLGGFGFGALIAAILFGTYKLM